MASHKMRSVVMLCVLGLSFGLTTTSLPVAQEMESSVLAPDGDIPTWYAGDQWTYRISDISAVTPNGTFTGTVDPLRYTVLGVSDDGYDVSISGHISGQLSMSGVSGTLSGEITGTSRSRCSDLADMSTVLDSTGTIMVIVVPVPYRFHILEQSQPPLEAFDFPLAVGESWGIVTLQNSTGYFVIEGFINESLNSSSSLNDTATCTAVESLSVPAGTFDCFVLPRSNSTVWYSPGVGNMVKSVVDEHGENTSMEATLTLQSFTRAAQPLTVTLELAPAFSSPGSPVTASGTVTATGSGQPVVGATVSISVPVTGDSFATTTDSQGRYSKAFPAPAFTDDTPAPRELGSHGVVASCTHGSLSGYRVRTLSLVVNQPPATPSIDGPAQGKIKTPQEFTVATVDPDGDDVSYFFDWGDGSTSAWLGPYPSAVNQTASHTFTKKTTYTVKVKARDVYGAETDWATLEVKIPKAVATPWLQWLLQRFPNAFPILRVLLDF